ncbi:hypothetical protein [Pistricoccus aurantiacus]|uniref:hypothetical protein n=1 Tax=Pistricoccus aurantiacus TaxID=1883414 RepID=UPI00164557B2|nr:hypothetical protein [Pistricoccus aurantiacus]
MHERQFLYLRYNDTIAIGDDKTKIIQVIVLPDQGWQDKTTPGQKELLDAKECS